MECGNLGSIQNMFEKKIKVKCEITSDLERNKSLQKSFYCLVLVLLIQRWVAFPKAV